MVASNEAPPQFYAGSTYVVLAVLNELRDGHRGLTLAYLRGSKLGRSHVINPSLHIPQAMSSGHRISEREQARPITRWPEDMAWGICREGFMTCAALGSGGHGLGALCRMAKDP